MSIDPAPRSREHLLEASYALFDFFDANGLDAGFPPPAQRMGSVIRVLLARRRTSAKRQSCSRNRNGMRIVVSLRFGWDQIGLVLVKIVHLHAWTRRKAKQLI